MEESKYKSLLRWNKKFCHLANSVPLLRGPCPPCWFTTNVFFWTSCNDKKTDNDAKRNNNIQSFLLKLPTLAVFWSFSLGYWKFSGSSSKHPKFTPMKQIDPQLIWLLISISKPWTNICIIFNSKYFMPKVSVSQTMGQHVQQAAKRFQI